MGCGRGEGDGDFSGNRCLRGWEVGGVNDAVNGEHRERKGMREEFDLTMKEGYCFLQSVTFICCDAMFSRVYLFFYRWKKTGTVRQLFLKN